MMRKPNIVWLVLDSIRADHTNMHGYRRDTTPNLQRIADSSDGTNFSNCFAHSNWSLPSDASMLTGTYPSYHGTGSRNEVLPEGVRTVPELLGDAGYYTAGLSLNGYLNSTTGLDRGFDRFVWLSKSNLLGGAGIRLTLRYLLNLRRHSAGLKPFPTQKHSTEFLVREVCKKWLKEFSGRNESFFFFVHAQAAHLPYYPPLPYLDEYVDEVDMSRDRALEVAFRLTNNYLEETANGCEFTEDEWGAIEAMYDAKIKYTDQVVGEIFDYVESELGDTVFVVTSDHGDLHGEYGVLGHLLALHDGITHVPLVVHGFDGLSQSDGLVQHIDVMQTLVSHAGGSTEQFQGVDLTKDSRRYALSQRGLEDARRLEKLREHHPDYQFPLGHSALMNCLRSDRYKYLESSAGKTLFELPDETEDVSDRHPGVVDEFGSALERVMEGIGPGLESSEKRRVPDAVRKQLSDLGYVE